MKEKSMKEYREELERISKTSDKKELRRLSNSDNPDFRKAVASNIHADVQKMLSDKNSSVMEAAAKTASAQKQMLFIKSVKRKIRRFSKEIKEVLGVEK
ncbi:MAG: hypothetical protein M1382_01925 [Candidatus Marsarchaeota archaeon]|nr:hypothetical protein [Candidatus Marsarchaeota archaeon]